jgi:hypothetical protein
MQHLGTTKEGGGPVRGNEESGWIASLAQNEVHVGAVLPGSGGPEHQASRALPRPTKTVLTGVDFNPVTLNITGTVNVNTERSLDIPAARPLRSLEVGAIESFERLCTELQPEPVGKPEVREDGSIHCRVSSAHKMLRRILRHNSKRPRHEGVAKLEALSRNRTECSTQRKSEVVR